MNILLSRFKSIIQHFLFEGLYVKKEWLTVLYFIFFPPPVSADNPPVDCQSYETQELAEMCSDSAYITVYNQEQVDERGLNALFEDWQRYTFPSELRVIPPGRYVISESLQLSSLNRVLPHPTSPLKPGQKRTIELVAAETFRPDGDGFHLIKLASRSQIGALEINGNQQPLKLLQSLDRDDREIPRNCLVKTAGHREIVLAASVLQGHEMLDGVACSLPGTTDYYFSERFRGITLERNHISTNGSRYGIAIVTGLSGNALTVRNNSVLIDPLAAPHPSKQSSGLFLARDKEQDEYARGKVITQNDFVFPERRLRNDTQRRAIEIADASYYQITLNAFLTSGMPAKSTQDIALFHAHETAQIPVLIDLSSNGFSTALTPVMTSPESSSTRMKILVEGAKAIASTPFYPLTDPECFMSYSGNLGYRHALVASGSFNTSQTLYPSDMQPRNATGITSYMNRAILSCPGPVCSNSVGKFNETLIFPVIIVSAFFAALNIGLGLFMRYRGKGKVGCCCCP